MIRKAKRSGPLRVNASETLPKWVRDSPWVVARYKTKITEGENGELEWRRVGLRGRPTKNPFSEIDAAERKLKTQIATIGAEMATARGAKHPAKQRAGRARQLNGTNKRALILSAYKTSKADPKSRASLIAKKLNVSAQYVRRVLK